MLLKYVFETSKEFILTLTVLKSHKTLRISKKQTSTYPKISIVYQVPYETSKMVDKRLMDGLQTLEQHTKDTENIEIT